MVTQISLNGKNYEIGFQALDTVPVNITDNGAKPLRVAGNVADLTQTFGSKVPATVSEVIEPVPAGFTNTEVLATAQEQSIVETMPAVPQTEVVEEIVTAEQPVATLPVTENVPESIPDIFAMPPAPTAVAPLAEAVSEVAVVEDVKESVETASFVEAAPVEATEERQTLEPVTFNLHEIKAPLEKMQSQANPTDDLENTSNDVLESLASVLTSVVETSQKVEKLEQEIVVLKKQIATMQVKEEVTALSTPVMESVPEPIPLIPQQPVMTRTMGSGLDMAA